jgi:hypothetical protein
VIFNLSGVSTAFRHCLSPLLLVYFEILLLSAETPPLQSLDVTDRDTRMIAQSQASAGGGTESTQGRSEAEITALVAQANRKSTGKGNSKDRAKKRAADEAVEAAGKELHLRHVSMAAGQAQKGYTSRDSSSRACHRY